MKSNLQIISGKYRGKKLSLPADARPTQNLARGALFNMLNEILNTAQIFTVWDAFAGSGAFGLECLSRYDNAKVIFTDNNKTSIDTVNKNLTSMREKAVVEMADAISVIQKYGANADLIFLDPPYADYRLGIVFVKKLAKVVKSSALLIWEFEASQEEPKIDDDWEILKDKTYGRARFLILRKK